MLCSHRLLRGSATRLPQRLCRSFSASTLVLQTAPSAPNVSKKPTEEELEAARRRRKTEWKRRQKGETFLDHTIIQVRAGRGGDGCVAFHREKFQEYGPPAGGDGGRGGDVYILPTPHLTTLSSVPRRVRAQAGGNGAGTWLHGRNAEPTIIRVPVGTIVRELTGDDPRRTKDEWEAEAESMEDMDLEERRKHRRELRFVHFPRYADENENRAEFREAEQTVYKEERELRIARRQRSLNPLRLDLDSAEEVTPDPNAPLGLGKQEPLGTLVARGGKGGFGNPRFHSPDVRRAPKFATRGWSGERVTLELELKLLADIGLVGMPNAGKSTLLRALTGGRARSEVAGYAFTTLNPVIAVVRVAEDGSYEGEHRPLAVQDETLVEEVRKRELMEQGEFAEAPTRNQTSEDSTNEDGVRAGHFFDLAESFRFTIADNPGLIERASENAGLGHSFLRSIERSPALVYVVDLSSPEPWTELQILRDELEKYKPGMSAKARMVVANKADLLASGDEQEVEAARAKLSKLQKFVEELGADGPKLDVVPTSAKFSQNLRKVVTMMKDYVEEARSSQSSS